MRKPNKKQKLPIQLEDVVREFIKDIKAVGLEHVEEEWPDLADTYRHAVEALRNWNRLALDAKRPLKIKRFLRTGELADEDGNTRDLLESLGNLLDHACSHDIFGEIVFLGEDDVWYVATVEGVIAPANPTYIAELMAEEDLS